MDLISALIGIGVFLFAAAIVWIACIIISGAITDKVIKMVRLPALEDENFIWPMQDKHKYVTKEEARLMIEEAVKEGKE